MSTQEPTPGGPESMRRTIALTLLDFIEATEMFERDADPAYRGMPGMAPGLKETVLSASRLTINKTLDDLGGIRVPLDFSNGVRYLVKLGEWHGRDKSDASMHVWKLHPSSHPDAVISLKDVAIQEAREILFEEALPDTTNDSSAD